MDKEDDNCDVEFGIDLTSELFGTETFCYDSEDERMLGLSRLSEKIESLGDGVDRELVFTNFHARETVAIWNDNVWNMHIIKDALPALK